MDRPDDDNGVQEWNFDGLIGPTHHYGGLSPGNVASRSHGRTVSNPRAAALEGLAKMRALADLGVRQAVVPPLERPALHVLRALGFTGSSDEAVLRAAARDAPELLSACLSASSMWTANAGTTTPATDHADGRVHFTPANLARNFHRAIEAPDTAALWRQLLPDPARFVHHPPLIGGTALADEGAANHVRLAPAHGRGPGLHLFVYGEDGADDGESPRPRRFPARQTRAASAAVARLHGLNPAHVVFAQQSPAAIDAGVFHNDVIATGNEGLFLCHADAFVDTPAVVAELAQRWRALYPPADAEPLRVRVVPASELPLAEAVCTYLFNAQLVTLPPTGDDDRRAMAFVAPAECRESPAASALLDGWLADDDNPIRAVRFLDLRGSMRNGGGPACLRQRVILSPAEAAALPPGIRFDAALHERLITWVRRNYRETLGPDDLASPDLLHEALAALDELTHILGLGPVYRFQRAGS